MAATWVGGDLECESLNESRKHAGRLSLPPLMRLTATIENRKRSDNDNSFMANNSVRFAASVAPRRIDQQLGLEPTPDCKRHGLMRLRSDLTEDQLRYVVQRLLALEHRDDESCDT